ncbi:MAG TPA: hypothetical protein VKY36_07185 [Moheibacter sp.]|nr:hypothetical protein [Moheibacter sp.]
MFQIKWEKQASDELLSILEYWIAHNQSDSYSRKILEEITKIENQLLKYPLAGVLTDFMAVRKIIFLSNFSLYYRLNNKILRFFSFGITVEILKI